MANKKTSELEILSAGEVSDLDRITILDVSDTSGAGSGTGGTLKTIRYKDVGGKGQLIKVTENGNTGYALDIDRSTKDPIGENAIDLGFTSGGGASGDYSISHGVKTRSVGAYSEAGGYWSESLGTASSTSGVENFAESYGERVIGFYAKIIEAVSKVNISALDFVFRVGIGNDGNNRKDAFQVKKNGEVIAPELTKTIIDAGDPRGLTTKEWVQDAVGGAAQEKEIKEVTAATYTLIADDATKILQFTNVAGCVVTIPDSLAEGRYEGKQMSSGQVEIVGDTGVDVFKLDDYTNKTAGKDAVFAIDWTGANRYTLYGSLELANVYEIPSEEDIVGDATYQEINGAVSIDLKAVAHRNIKLLGNSVITFTGLPSVGESFVRTMIVWGDAGTETFGITNSDREYESYDALVENSITVLASNSATVGLKVDVYFSKPN